MISRLAIVNLIIVLIVPVPGVGYVLSEPRG